VEHHHRLLLACVLAVAAVAAGQLAHASTLPPPPEECAYKFLGTWTFGHGSTEVFPDGTAKPRCFLCGSQTWTCEGNKFIFIVNGRRGEAVLRPDGVTLAGIGNVPTSTRAGGPAPRPTQVRTPAAQAASDPSAPSCSVSPGSPLPDPSAACPDCYCVAVTNNCTFPATAKFRVTGRTFDESQPLQPGQTGKVCTGQPGQLVYWIDSSGRNQLVGPASGQAVTTLAPQTGTNVPRQPTPLEQAQLFGDQARDLLRRNEPAAAAIRAREALELDPNNQPAHIALGEIAQANGNRDEARKHFLAARNANPNSADAAIAAARLQSLDASASGAATGAAAATLGGTGTR
jgi:hypothetical protein